MIAPRVRSFTPKWTTPVRDDRSAPQKRRDRAFSENAWLVHERAECVLAADLRVPVGREHRPVDDDLISDEGVAIGVLLEECNLAAGLDNVDGLRLCQLAGGADRDSRRHQGSRQGEAQADEQFSDASLSPWLMRQRTGRSEPSAPGSPARSIHQPSKQSAVALGSGTSEQMNPRKGQWARVRLRWHRRGDPEPVIRQRRQRERVVEHSRRGGNPGRQPRVIPNFASNGNMLR